MLHFGFVQNYLAQKAAGYLSEKLKTEVSVGAVDITFFLDISLHNLTVKDKHGNPIIDAGDMTIDLEDIYFKKNLININNISISDASICLKKYKNEKELNFQFIIDEFASKDTTNIDSSKAWFFRIGGLNLTNDHFVYQDENQKPLPKGLDFSHLDMDKLNLKVSNINLIGDTLFTAIDKLSFNDKSGFSIKEFSSIVLLSSNGIEARWVRLKTPGSHLAMNIDLQTKDYSDFSDFMAKVKLDISLKPSIIDIADLAYFATDLWGMNNKVAVAGEFKGKISKLKGKNVYLKYGYQTTFFGDLSVTGLPDINETFIKLKVIRFTTSPLDLASFKLPSETGIKYLTIPDELIRMGSVRFSGQFTGFYYDFVANGDFKTDVGSVFTDLSLRKNKTSGAFEYNGNVNSSGFNIGRILGIEDQLGSISMNADLKGSGLNPDNASLDIKGTIYSVDFRNYHYNNIRLTGTFDKKKFIGNADIHDENIQLDVNGMADFSSELPVFNLHANIDRLRLSKLNFLKIEGDSLSYIATTLDMNYSGNNIDNIQGSIVAENTSYFYKRKKYELDKFEFINTAQANGDKTLVLNSDYADAEFKGNFRFKDMYKSFLKFTNDYLPSFSPGITEKFDSIPEENFTYKITVKNVQPLCELFLPELKIAKNTMIKGSYNTLKSILEINLTSAGVGYEDKMLKDFFLSGKTENSRINLNIGCEHIMISDSSGFDNVVLKTITQHDSIWYSLNWKNNNDFIKNSGDIIGFTNFNEHPRIETKLLQANITINDSVWQINPENYIVIDSSSITVTDFVIGTKYQQLKLNGTISDNPNDIFIVTFKDVNISDFDALVRSNNDVDFDGLINGNVHLSNIYKSPVIVADIVASEFYINKDWIGKAQIVSTWDNSQKALQLKVDFIYEGTVGSNIPVSLSGYYYPEREKDNFDIDIDLKNFKLRLLERYISAISSNFKGYATGKLKLKGTPVSPDLSGMLYLMVKGFRVDYLNTNYSFTDSVEVTKNSFIFDKMVIYDSRGDTAIFDGKIIHERFYDFFLDFTIKPYNFECLNTNSSQNSLFYGKAYATGIFKVYGNVNNITMDISAKTEKGTQFNIPISDGYEITQSDFITFESKYSDIGKKIKADAGGAGISLNFDLDVTNNAAIQIIFDSKIGDVIKARGSGNIIMKYNTLGDFNMYGGYTIDEGDYLFTLKNVINKKFLIRKGSTIKFDGDPYDADADILAVYPVKTALYDLVMDSSEVYKKRINVECLLTMKDNLMNPTLTFDINLPNSDETTKTLVKGLINNDQEMNRQIFSLLVLNRFMPLETYQLSGGFSSTSTELLSNQLSNWLSQISKDFDVNVNYRPGTQMTNEEVEVALSTQLFNDRLSIDGNVGVSGGQANKSSNIVGDVNVDYKITDDGRLRVKGFNRSNTVDMLNTNSPYTQGLGILYRRDFDVLKELFLKKKKAEKKKK
jgi:hypothetical protein